MNKIEMTVCNVLTKMRDGLMFAFVLKEKDGSRILPVMVGLLEAQSIAMSLRDVSMPRPPVYDLYVNTFQSLGASLKEVLVYRIKGGVFYSYLIFEKDGQEIPVDSRTSDAVAIALRCGAPIFIDEELLQANCAKEEAPGAYSMPISTVGEDVLRSAMEEAVKAENYELAAKLRDELNSRKNTADNV